MKKLILSLALSLMAIVSLTAQQYPFQDNTRSVEQRVEDLLARLTLDEKLSLMEHQNPAIPRLGIPAYSWWNEALHGVGRDGLATVYPMPIAMAATFDPTLIYRTFSQIALEARMKHKQDTQQGKFSDYNGLTFFTPNINIFRDPRWGRGMETYGEDPCLTALMGRACVEGLQHSFEPFIRADVNTALSAAACLKHLAVHSGPEGYRHEFDSRVDDRDLWTTYLPAFEYIINNTDVQQVMCGYNRLNGQPCCTNRELLVDILRNKWGYKGLLVTDCWALNDCWERDTVIPRHKTHATAVQAAAAAFGSEVDLECGSGLSALRMAVDSGYIAEAKINQHVRRILTTRMRTAGMDWPISYNPIQDDAEILAASSLVMLKNSHRVLPLNPDNIQSLLLCGPNANDTLMPLGNYNGTPAHTVSIMEGMRKIFKVVPDGYDKVPDVVVYAGGLNPTLEGEELPIDKPGFYKGDRTQIELPSDQVREIKELRKLGCPIVLLLCTGSAIALDEVLNDVDAIVVCWYGGQDMGSAVAKTLAGEYNLFGRLPVTFYKSTDQLPSFDNYSMQGRTYRYMTDKPLFPFGYGLSYTETHYADLKLDAEHRTLTGTIVVDNAYADHYFGREPVQVYVKNMDDPDGPIKTLVAVKSIPFNGRNMASFTIPIDNYWFRVYDPELHEMIEPAKGTHFMLLVGPSSDNADCYNLPFEY